MVENQLLGCITADALRLHAFDNFGTEYLQTLGALASAALKAALERESLEKEIQQKEEWAQSLSEQASSDFIGSSSQALQFKQQLSMVANSPFPLLITGETGTGKEVAANLAHRLSPRKDRPFISINCAALPESMAESELFGHKKGAFTGAIKNRAGRFEIADKGTLFLDELGELPLSLQAKLLRVLQEGEIQRVGADHPIKVDVRIIAATNKNLAEEVDKGNFRADLFHRLSVFPIQIPSLRDRLDDIDELAPYFFNQALKKLKCHSKGLSSRILKEMKKWSWAWKCT